MRTQRVIAKITLLFFTKNDKYNFKVLIFTKIWCNMYLLNKILPKGAVNL